MSAAPIVFISISILLKAVGVEVRWSGFGRRCPGAPTSQNVNSLND